MVDGSKAYLHGVIDNYSRRILAWHVSAKFETASTITVLLDAIGSRTSNDKPEVLADDGGENVNGKVDELIEFGLLKRTLAQTGIRFSNSKIEAWWRALKH